MEKSKEVYNVIKCPVCGKAHKYSLTILRSSYLYGKPDANVGKRVRRLFTCPAKGEDFEGIITLQEDPQKKIASITVNGVISEEE